MNEDDNEMFSRLKRKSILICVIFVSILLMAAAVYFIFKQQYIYQHTFSMGKWGSSPNTRYKIVDDMLEQYQLIGMSEADVGQLLGQEDTNEITSFKQNQQYYPTDSTLVYWLGVPYMNDNWLVISTEHGIVTEYCFGET